MATAAAGQPTNEVVQPPHNPPLPYSSILKPNIPTAQFSSVPIKIVSYLHGEPKATWSKEEFNRLILKENLQFAIVGKFSYGRPEMKDLRQILPSQCDIKGECKIGYVDYRYILIRLTTLEDYVNLLSKPAFYIQFKGKEFPMRTLKWTPWFDPKEETSIAIAWISLPALPHHLFAKESIFTIASAVGKPLKVDMATENQTRPSCARVKVEVDLLGNFPQRFQINCVDPETNEVVSKWTKIKYDYMPSYCKTCRIQGHKEEECKVVHPELVQNKTDDQLAVAQTKSDRVLKHQLHKDLGNAENKKNDKMDEFKQVRYKKKNANSNRKPYAWITTKDNRVVKPDQQQENKLQASKQDLVVAYTGEKKEHPVVGSTNQFAALQAFQEVEQSQVDVIEEDGLSIVAQKTEAQPHCVVLTNERNPNPPVEAVIGIDIAEGSKKSLSTVNVPEIKSVMSNPSQEDATEKGAAADSHKTHVVESTKKWIERSFGKSNIAVTNTEPAPGKHVFTAMLPATTSVDGETGQKVNNVVVIGTGSAAFTTAQPVNDEAEVLKAKKQPCFDALLAKSHAQSPNTAGGRVDQQDGCDTGSTTLTPTAQLVDICKAKTRMNNTPRQSCSTFKKTINPPVGSTIAMTVHDGNELETYFLGDIFSEAQNNDKVPTIDGKTVHIPKTSGKHNWNVNAPDFVPKASSQVGLGVLQNDSDSDSDESEVSLPSDGELLERMNLYDTKGLLRRQNIPPKDLPTKIPIVPPDFVDSDPEYEDEDEFSTAQNDMHAARIGALSPRVEEAKKPKLVKKERAPLERRTQPPRSLKRTSNWGFI